MASILSEAFNITTTAIAKYNNNNNNTNGKLAIGNNGNVSTSWLSTGRIQIPLYATILLLAIVGNSLVILTLVQNRRMRTITNVFLLNLAVSDILLGVLCMPFTLIGTLLRDFVFGEVMCKLLPYLQGKCYTKKKKKRIHFNFRSHERSRSCESVCVCVQECDVGIYICNECEARWR